MRSLILATALLASAPLLAQQSEPRTAQIDYVGFSALTDEVFAYREKRMVDLGEFRKRAEEADTLILDTRSAAAFKRGHIVGAVNLPFSDFTDESLRAVIGDNPGRAILIYCNNNFSDDIPPVVAKKAPLALNIPTFINLYGYGYRNVFELAGSYSISDPAIGWVSSETAE